MSILSKIRVIDGGLASELENLGARTNGPLWSAHVLEDEPTKVAAVHREYIDAGAQCIATCSYQVSRMGYAEVGLSAERADSAILRSVELARSVCNEFPDRRVLIACSLGPYGAALHNRGEYHGNYDCSYADLVQFHRERIDVVANAKGNQIPDLIAFETFPSLKEALAVCEALAPWPDLPAWFSFSCRDENHVSHGEPVRECAGALAKFPQIAAIGVNCVPPKWVPSLIEELRSGSNLPVLVYPNSGEGWDSSANCWLGESNPYDFGRLAAEWFATGADIIGGCCRIGPAHMREVAEVAAQLSLG